MLPGDRNGLLDRALQTVLVRLPSDLWTLAADSELATGADEPSFA
jgi:hypothetical protein